MPEPTKTIQNHFNLNCHPEPACPERSRRVEGLCEPCVKTLRSFAVNIQENLRKSVQSVSPDCRQAGLCSKTFALANKNHPYE